MYISQMQIENYRLLKNVTIDFDRALTLFVGKNNTGKTSIMNIIELLLSDKKNLPFEDYPLDCRKTLYEAVKAYWESADENPFVAYKNTVPVVSITIKIDYSEEDESYGAAGWQAALSYKMLVVNQVAHGDLLRLAADGVHASEPFQLIAGLEGFGHTLGSG